MIKTSDDSWSFITDVASLAQMCLICLGVGVVFGPYLANFIDTLEYGITTKAALMYARPIILIPVGGVLWLIINRVLNVLISLVRKEKEKYTRKSSRLKVLKGGIQYLEAAEEEIIILVRTFSEKKKNEFIKRVLEK